jgi:hypothetical protein
VVVMSSLYRNTKIHATRIATSGFVALVSKIVKKSFQLNMIAKPDSKITARMKRTNSALNEGLNKSPFVSVGCTCWFSAHAPEDERANVTKDIGKTVADLPNREKARAIAVPLEVETWRSRNPLSVTTSKLSTITSSTVLGEPAIFGMYTFTAPMAFDRQGLFQLKVYHERSAIVNSRATSLRRRARIGSSAFQIPRVSRVFITSEPQAAPIAIWWYELRRCLVRPDGRR